MTSLRLETLHDYARTVVDQLAPGLLVRVAELSLESEIPQGGNLEVEGQLSIKVGLDSETHALGCSVNYSLTAVPEEDASRPMWRVALEMDGQWALVGSAENLTDDHLRAFAVKVGLMALHPYARAHIQNAVTSTGWPPYALDVITAPDALFGGDQEGSVDLEGISVTRTGS